MKKIIKKLISIANHKKRNKSQVIKLPSFPMGPAKVNIADRDRLNDLLDL